MYAADAFTLSKQERIRSKKLINELFTGTGSRSMTAFPIRVVFLKREHIMNEPKAAMLVSVPKRYFKHAVDRNKVKRQIREAFRRNKPILTDHLQTEGDTIAVAFIWLAACIYPTAEVENRIVQLMKRISERL